MTEKMTNDQAVEMVRDNAFWEEVYHCMEALHCHKDEAISVIENANKLQLQHEESPNGEVEETTVENEIENTDEDEEIYFYNRTSGIPIELSELNELSKYFE